MSITGHDNANLMTQRGYDRLCEEREFLNSAQDEVAARLRSARANGTEATDSAELMDALEEQAFLRMRIATIDRLLAHARIADAGADGSARPGTMVSLRTSSGVVHRYELVGAGEADGSPTQISIGSPVGQALLGRRPGERVEVQAPRRVRRFELVSVEPTTALAA